MSQFSEALQELHVESRGFEKLRENLNDQLIEAAFDAEDLPKTRNRRLPKVTIIWLVVGMALFRRESIQQIAKSFNLFTGPPPTSGSISDARKRLGPDALRWLFRKLGLKWCERLKAERWKGLQTFGIDGSVLTLEDTKANVAEFGKAGNRSDKSPAARPQARVVGLMELSTKMLVDAEVVPLKAGENTAVQPLFDRIPADSITILDRGFQSRINFHKLYRASENKHFLCRAKISFEPKWVKNLTSCSWLASIKFTALERREDESLPEEMLIRVIEYKVVGGKNTIRLMTSLLDETSHPAKAMANLYHLRWEFELGLRDLKVTLLDSRDNLRSKKPEGVRQEIWAIFLGYNLVRHEIATVANYHGVSPRRLSFKTALISVGNFFRTFSSGYADVENAPAAVKDMREWMWQKRLPERNPERICPRWIKDKQPSSFPKKPSTPAGV